MKVVLINPTYFGKDSVYGGAERYVREFAFSLSAYVGVELISFGKKTLVIQDDHKCVIRIFKSWNRNVQNPFNPLFLIRLFKADVIHCFQYMNYANKMAILLGWILRKKVFVTDLGQAQLYPPWYFDWSRLIKSFLTISQFSANMLTHHHAKKHVMYGGVDTDIFKFSENKKPYVLFVGRLLPHKGINYLIEALPENTHLRVIGQPYDAVYYDYLRNLAKGKKVEFLNDVSDELLKVHLQEALVFVFPSVVKTVYGKDAFNSELLGLAVLEAMACGCAVIASRIGSLPEIIEDGVNGLLVEPNNPAEIKQKIELLFTNHERAHALGKAARRTVQERFEWDQTVKQAVAFYNQNVP